MYVDSEQIANLRRQRGFATVDFRSTQKVCGFDSSYYQAWLTYIRMCQRQQDLFEYAKAYGVGSFEASFV